MKIEEHGQKYLKQLEPKLSDFQSPGGQPYCVGLMGQIGSGKTTFANLLAERLDVYVINTDRIRQYFYQNGHDDIEEINDYILDKLAFQVFYKCLDQEISFIIDADTSSVFEKVKNELEEREYLFYPVKITCSEETILKRIEQRLQTDSENPSRGTKEEYFERKEQYQNLSLPFYITVNSEADMQPAAEWLTNILPDQS